MPLDARSPGLLRLGRFALEGDGPIEAQCRTYRSDLLLYGLFRDGYLKFIRGVPTGPGRRRWRPTPRVITRGEGRPHPEDHE